MVTPSVNMTAVTGEMVMQTSNYMKYLTDQISKIPEAQVPYGVKQISQELIDSLLKLSGLNTKKVVLVRQSLLKSSSDSASLPSLNQTDFSETASLPPNDVRSDKDQNNGLNKGSFSLGGSSTSSPKGSFMDTQSLKRELDLIDFGPSKKDGNLKSSNIPSVQNESDDKAVVSAAGSLAYLNIEKTKTTKNNGTQLFVTDCVRTLIEYMTNSQFSDAGTNLFYCQYCDRIFTLNDESNEHSTNANNNNRSGKENLICDKCKYEVISAKELMLKYNFLIHDNDNKEERGVDHVPKFQMSEERKKTLSGQLKEEVLSLSNPALNAADSTDISAPDTGSNLKPKRKKKPKNKKAVGKNESTLPQPSHQSLLEDSCTNENQNDLIQLENSPTNYFSGDPGASSSSLKMSNSLMDHIF